MEKFSRLKFIKNETTIVMSIKRWLQPETRERFPD